MNLYLWKDLKSGKKIPYTPAELRSMDQPLTADDLLSAEYDGADPSADFKAAKLPDKWSDLLAVADAVAASKTPGVRLAMGDWLFRNKDRKTCEVCMAGAVMLRKLKCGKSQDIAGNEYFNPSNFGQTVEEKMWLINSVRDGSVGCASWTTDAQDRVIDDVNSLIRANYNYALDQGRAPWPVYLMAANMLRNAGL